MSRAVLGGRRSLKKHYIIMICFIAFVIAMATPQTSYALQYDGEYTNQLIPAGDWWKVWDTFSQGDTFSGYFETHSETQGLKFFICDETNIAIWEGGETATVYNLETNMHTLGFEYTIPTAGTWYAVFSNDGGSTDVTADIGVDINDDNTPYYSSSSYDVTRYGEVLEDDEYYYYSQIYNVGDQISGHFSTFFITDGVDFFICDETNYGIWDSGGTADVFNLKDDYHAASIDSFTVPTAGRWYCIFSAIGEGDTVTLSFGINLDLVTTTSPGTTTPTTTTSVVDGEGLGLGTLLALGAVVFVFVLVIAVCRSRGRGRVGVPPGTEVITPGPAARPRAEPSYDRRAPTEPAPRVLVICPYCGSKTEQGILNCQNCDAEL